MMISNCCGYPTFYETDLCGNCKEHAEFHDDEDICRGCGHLGIFIKGLCKQCAEDTYIDRDEGEDNEYIK